jgi:hypothetical protein
MISTMLTVVFILVLYHVAKLLYAAFWRWWCPQYLTLQEEKYFEEALANVNSDASGETRRRPDGLVATCVNAAKNEFPMLKRSKANYLMVHKFLNGKFHEDPDFREKNIQDVLPLAVEMVFIASDGELLARKFRASKAAQDREGTSLVNWFSFGVRNPIDLGFADE